MSRDDDRVSAYVVVEATVRDQEARDRYGSQASAVLKQFGAEVVTFGPWRLLCGEPGHANGMIIRFQDKDTALAWYNSPAYQALLDIRDAALDCRFRLVG
jgi:uncharacterized protein (DUF1330 family)